MKYKFLVLITVIFIAGCVPANTAAPQAVPASGVSAVSTANYITAAETATATARKATAAANLANTRTAETAVAATATTYATETQVAATSTGEHIAAVSTLTILDITKAAANTVNEYNQIQNRGVEEALDAQNTDYVLSLQLERERERAEINRINTWNDLIPLLMLSFYVLLVAGIVAFGFWLHRRLNPKVVSPYDFNFGDIEQVPPDMLSQITNLLANPPSLFITDGSGVMEVRRQARTTVEAEPPLIESTAAIDLTRKRPFKWSHTIIAGETRSGKSTLARYILYHLEQQEQVKIFAVDPHFEAGNWGNIYRVIGKGRRFHEEIKPFFHDYMLAELDRRAKVKGDDHTAVFDPVVVLMDELPAISAALTKQDTLAWRQWAREGFKYNLFLMAITQSTRVETLGIKGEKDVLRNFLYRFALGAVATEEYPGVADHMDRPGVMVTQRGPVPFTYPNFPVDPRDQARDATGLTAYTTAPAPAPAETGLTTQWGYVERPLMDHIIQAYQQAGSMRAVEREVFHTEKGAEGGHNFYKVKAVLVHVGLVRNEAATNSGRPVIINQ